MALKFLIVVFCAFSSVVQTYATDELPIRYVNVNNYDPTSSDYGNPRGCDGLTYEKGFATLAKAARYAYDNPATRFLVGPGVYSNETFGIGYQARCRLMDGTVLESMEGPEKTIIVGASATVGDESGFGNGDDAVPCVEMASNSILRGFTVTGGHTKNEQDSNTGYGGAIWANDEKGVVNVSIENCIITNNYSYGVVCFMGKYVNCVIKDNKSVRSSAVSRASLINCLITDNFGVRSAVDLYKVVNCTFGPYTPDASTDYLPRCGVWNPKCPLINSVFITDVDSGSGAAGYLYMTNCIYIGSVPHGVYAENCRRVDNAVAIGFDAGYRPLKDSVVVGFGTNELYLAEARDVDFALDNVPRILNINIDAGAYEYDWRSDFAAVLGSEVVVTNVSAEVTLNDEGKVVVPDTKTISGYLKEKAGCARCVFNANPEVTGMIYPEGRHAVAVSGQEIKDFSYGLMGFSFAAVDDVVLGEFIRMPIGLTFSIQ